MSNNDNNEITITRIERKSKQTFKQKFNSFIENFKLNVLRFHYSKENIIFKMIYDKLYRPELYLLIISIDPESQITTQQRNLLTYSETRYPYTLIKPTNIESILTDDDTIITSTSEIIKDDEEINQHNYLHNCHNNFFKTYVSFSLFAPFFIFSIYSLFYKKNTSMFIFSGFLSFCNTIYQTSLGNERNKFDKTYYISKFKQGHENEIKAYLNVFNNKQKKNI